MLVNSSLQTSVPEAMLGEKAWVATVLLRVPGGAAAIAFRVRFDETRKGAMYCSEVSVGVVPSVV